MSYRAIIPVKALREAKSRLAADLTIEQRARLVLSMLRHVVEVLQSTQSFTSIAVVSSDPLVRHKAQEWGANAYHDEQAGHNPALTAAASRELAAGATALLTISADLPALQTLDIDRMLSLSERYQVVLAASRDETGTNAVLLRPPLVLPYLFGPGSLQRYEAQAEQQGLSYIRYSSISSGLDIDTIHDLMLLRRYAEIAPHPTYLT